MTSRRLGARDPATRTPLSSCFLAAAAVAISLAATATAVGAQELPVLAPDHVQLITQEVSGDAAYEHIRSMTRFHRPRGGADGLWAVAEYYETKAREFGLADVQLIKQAATTPPWNARFADLWIVEPVPERIASTLQSPLHLADFSRRADVTAELVDVGGATPEELDRAQVSGKIVLTYAPIARAMQEAVWSRGALGVVWYPDPLAPGSGTAAGGFPFPDQLRWGNVGGNGPSGKVPTFAFVLSLRQAAELRTKLATSEEPVRVRAVVDADFDSSQGPEPWQVMVEAFIPGSEPGLGQDVVVTGHLQEEGTSANDDASGTASVAEVARALNRLIEDGRLPRPRRNLRFWWVTEISSQRQYFADHPEAHRSMWVNVNQDMVGANQAQDVMRKQNVTRLPATRFHFYNDVVEAVVEYMVAGNTFELAQAQNGIPFYPKPHLAHLGTRHRYNAEVIFFHNNTDHMPFNEAPIGVPATTFTNMPDHYIHSSDDDLWNIDRTQLGRNAASVALIAYTMASAGAESVPGLVAETVGRGAERQGRNLRLALTWIATGSDAQRAYWMARHQVRYAADRERMAVRSLGEIDPSARDRVESLLQEVGRRETQALRELDLAYRQATGNRQPGDGEMTAVERELDGLRPALTAGPGDFLEGRGRIRGVDGLHDLMAFEVLNAVDGRRSGLEIARFVAAEAREAGAHYYGTVTPEAVLEYLQNVEDAGLIRLQ